MLANRGVSMKERSVSLMKAVAQSAFSFFVLVWMVMTSRKKRNDTVGGSLDPRLRQVVTPAHHLGGSGEALEVQRTTLKDKWVGHTQLMR